MANKQYYIYMMASKRNGMLYIGVTSELIKRVYEHKNDLVEGFTSKYHIHNLVYFEIAENMTSAISREKQLKKWNRAWKIALLEKKNPEWHDLYCDLVKQEQYPR
ncbi:MAG: GIY-YIG nuclease family protein [Nitrospirota bacterium]